MKYTDNYDAKFEIWAREEKVYPLASFPPFPNFRAKKFSSYEELNQWKRSLLDQLAANWVNNGRDN